MEVYFDKYGKHQRKEITALKSAAAKSTNQDTFKHAQLIESFLKLFFVNNNAQYLARPSLKN